MYLTIIPSRYFRFFTRISRNR